MKRGEHHAVGEKASASRGPSERVTLIRTIFDPEKQVTDGKNEEVCRALSKCPASEVLPWLREKMRKDRKKPVEPLHNLGLISSESHIYVRLEITKPIGAWLGYGHQGGL